MARSDQVREHIPAFLEQLPEGATTCYGLLGVVAMRRWPAAPRTVEAADRPTGDRRGLTGFSRPAEAIMDLHERRA